MDSGQVHLSCVFFAEIVDATILAEYRKLLSPAERQQEQRFHFARDRHRYLVTRALVRTTLSRYASVAPEDWIFIADRYGRPVIVNDDPQVRRITFNVTHTHSLIILGICLDGAMGVDTENIRDRQASVEIADRFFSAKEVRDLRALPEDAQQHRFFEYWTLKESYIKARGMGLSIPLDQFGFGLASDDAVDVWVHPAQNDPPSRWNFWQFRPGPEYLAAVCVERNEAGTILLPRKVVPLLSEEKLEIVPLRASSEWRLA